MSPSSRPHRLRPPRSARTRAAVAAAAVAKLLVVAWVAGAEDPPPVPNVVLLIADDLGYGEPGCQGGDLPTPAIDSIAARGIRFTQGYVTAAYCSASRAGLFTGRIQNRFGYEFNPVGSFNLHPDAGLPPGERTLADHLSEAGYATALVGKWHLGTWDDYFPLSRGFDRFFGFLHEGHYFVPPPYRGVTSFLRVRSLPPDVGDRLTLGDITWSTHMGHDEPPYDLHNPLLRGRDPIMEREHLTDAFTREAVAFIEEQKTATPKRPFFLTVAYNAVHSPMQGADRFMARFAGIDDLHRRVFAAMLAHLDESVGRILECLEKSDLARDTLVVFLSDNGGPTRELTSSNAPLRGGKGQLYEGGIRVPFLMQWPARLPAGRVDERPVWSLDLLPTILAAAGAEAPEPTDGRNLLPQLTESGASSIAAPATERTFWWRTGNRAALRRGDWKAVRRSDGSNDAAWELYDLSVDPAESDDRAGSEPDRLARLVAAWQTFDAEMREPLWQPGWRPARTGP